MAAMGNVLELLSEGSLAAAAVGCIYLLAAAVMVLRFPRDEITGPDAAAEPVTILKPLYGAEVGLSQRLARFCRQGYPADVQVVCGVAGPADPAAGAADRADETIELVVDERQYGSNPKVSNLINMLRHARHDILIISDSDIDVGTDYVAKATAALATPGVGAVTCLYTGIGSAGVWSRLSALAINSHFLPSAILALTLKLAQPCFGATIALRRSMLHRIGGFDAFKDVLADDNAIGEAVRAHGQQVIIPGFAVGHVCQERTLSELLLQDLRIARTIRSVDPVGYCGLLFTHPFALALLAMPFAPGHAAVVMMGLALACRAAVTLAVRRAFKAQAQGLWLIPLRDLLSFATYVCGLLGSSVQWRGMTYQVSADGELSPGRPSA